MVVFFQQFTSLSCIEKYEDYTEYNEPDDIILQLGHKDVVLSFFTNKQSYIHKLRSGDALTVDGDYLVVNWDNNNIRIIKFSSACRNQINTLKAQGYNITNATIRFIVFWKDKEENELAIILPDIRFKK